MQKIHIRDLSNVKIIKSSSSSYIMNCLYNNHQYCYKEIRLNNRERVFNNIEGFTDLKEIKGLILPKMIVVNYDNNEIGYLSKYINCKTMEDANDLSRDAKIRILKSTKQKIELMHDKYRIIHGDLHTRNICIDRFGKASIIDFDEASTEEKEDMRLTLYARKYILKNGYDFNLDKYIFNITTYAFVNNIKFGDVTWSLLNGYYGQYRNKGAVKELNNIVRVRTPKRYLIDLI